MFNILIPSAGGPAAVGCIKALRMSSKKCKIISVDTNPLSAGLFLSDKYYIVPNAIEESSLLKRTIEICKSEKIDIIMPTSDFDTSIHAKNRKLFEEMGVSLPFSDYHIIQGCLNKLSLYKSIRRMGVIPFTTDRVDKIDLPFIVKEKIGRGPRQVFTCNKQEDLECICSNLRDPIFQKQLTGKEFSVDVLSDLKGNPLVAVPRERIETKAGISSKGRIELDPEIRKICLDVAKEMKIKGPSCIQLIRDKDNKPQVIDLNPRMGGGTIITILAGINFPEILIKLCNNENFVIQEPNVITVTRYWDEIVINE